MVTAPFDRTPVADPSELGIDAEAVDALVARIQQAVDDGITPGGQFALARDGKVAVWRSVGESKGPESRYVIFSATKTMVAGAVWILMGEGAIDVTKRVVDYVPEFGTNGKDVITVEQVMLHTSGFPHAPFNGLEWDDKEKRYARFAKWRTNWEPGTRFEYHPTSAHWVLAELIERTSGEDFRTFIRSRIIEPLGITKYELGVPPEHGDDINELVNTGEPMSQEELKAFGITSLPVTEVTPEALVAFNQPRLRAVGVPGGGGVSTAADLALYYQGLLHDPAGIWKPDVLADVKTQVRNTFPDYIGTPANRSRGLVIAGDDGKSGARGMGKTVSPRAFGHNGAGGQIAWADPETGLSFCYLMNGLDQNQLRGWRLTTAIASRAGNCVKR